MFSREAPPQPGTEARRPPHTPGSSPANRPSEERRIIAWVGKFVVFKGDLISSQDITIDGRVEGSIEVREHCLTIGPDADIRANIVARVVTVLGKVTGTVTASGKVEIRETGSVDGDVISPRLAMSDGAVLRGRVESEARHALAVASAREA